MMRLPAKMRGVGNLWWTMAKVARALWKCNEELLTLIPHRYVFLRKLGVPLAQEMERANMRKLCKRQEMTIIDIHDQQRR